ncbi:MAG: ATP-dependent metallopeptidase FtsH/Yme1/Tma family protein [Desulfobacteraceae bacterium]
MLYNIFNQQQQMAETDIGYSEFIAMVEKDRVAKVVIQGQELYITDINGSKFSSFAPEDDQLVKTLREKGVNIKAKPPAEASWFMSIIISWLPMIVLIGVWIFFMRQMQGGAAPRPAPRTCNPSRTACQRCAACGSGFRGPAPCRPIRQRRTG